MFNLQEFYSHAYTHKIDWDAYAQSTVSGATSYCELERLTSTRRDIYKYAENIIAELNGEISIVWNELVQIRRPQNVPSYRGYISIDAFEEKLKATLNMIESARYAIYYMLETNEYFLQLQPADVDFNPLSSSLEASLLRILAGALVVEKQPPQVMKTGS